MNPNLMQESLDLMMYGVGVVFVFLSVLVIATILMSAVIQRWFPEPEPAPTQSPGKRSSQVDPLTLKIIKAALEQHRRR